eukprot:gene4668-5833_t
MRSPYVHSQDPRCLDFSDNSVGSWFIYRLRNDDYLYYDTNISKLYGARDANDDLAKLSSETSPLFKTWNQAKINNNLGYVVYSDSSRFTPMQKINGVWVQNSYAKDIEKTKSTYGHTKGFAYWNPVTGRGIHIVHSLPGFPFLTTELKKYSDALKNKIHFNRKKKNVLDWIRGPSEIQSMLCYEFDDPSIVSTYLARNRATIWSLYKGQGILNVLNPMVIPSSIRVDFQAFLNDYKNEMSTIYKKCKTSKNSLANCLWNFQVQDTATKGLGIPGEISFFMKTDVNVYSKPKNVGPLGTFVTRVDKSGKVLPNSIGIDIWVSVVEYYQNTFFVATQMKSAFRKFDNVNTKLVNAMNINLHSLLNSDTKENSKYFSGDPNYDVANEKNHCKLAYSLLPDPLSSQPKGTKVDPNIFCVGDLNRQHRQQLRGGGAVCFGDLTLALSFNRAVAQYSSDNPNKLNSYSTYTKNNVKILDNNGKPAQNVWIEIGDRIFTKADPQTLPPIKISRSPKKMIRTDSNGEITFTFNSLRNKVDPKEKGTFLTRYIRSNSLYSLWYYLGTDNILVCDGDNIDSCKNKEDTIYSSALVSSDKEIGYPSSNPLVYNVLDTGIKTYKLDLSTIKEYPFIKIGEGLLSRWKKMYPSSTKFPILKIMKHKTSSYFTIHNNEPIIYFMIDPKSNKIDEESFSYLYTQYILYAELGTDISNTGEFGKGFILAVSKLLYNRYSKTDSTIFNSNFMKNINGLPTGPQEIHPFPTMDYDIEKTDPKNYMNKNRYRIASAFWDLWDSVGEPETGNGKIQYEDANNLHIKKMSNYITALKTMIPSTSILIENLIDIMFPINGQARIYPKKSTLLKIESNSTGSSKQLFASTYDLVQILKENFEERVVDQLTPTQLEQIQESLNHWVTLSDIYSEAINVLLKDSVLDQQKLAPVQVIHYLQEIGDIDVQYGSPQICFNSNDDAVAPSDSTPAPTSEPEYFSICDPMSIPSLTDTINDLIQSTLTSNQYSVGDLRVYYQPKSSQFGMDFPYDGIVVATINSKILDVKLAMKSQFDDLSILNDLGIRAGPIFDQINTVEGPSTGNYPITISGAHFKAGDVSKIGSTNCLSSNFLSSVSLECIVPPGTGYGQLISFQNRPSFQQTKFYFSYQKPQITGISKISNQGGPFTISGQGFGIKKEDISVSIGPIDSLIQCTIDDVIDTKIECQMPKYDGTTIRLLNIRIKNQIITIRFNINYDLSSFSTQYQIYPGDTISITDPTMVSESSSDIILVGNFICPKSSSTSTTINCILSTPITTLSNKISLQDSYSIYESPSTVSYKETVIQQLVLPPIVYTTGSKIRIKGQGLNTIEQLDYFKVGKIGTTIITDYSTSCQVLNSEMECKLPKGIGASIPIYVSFSGKTLQANSQPTTYSYSKPHIKEVFIHQSTISIKGTNFVPQSVSPVDSEVNIGIQSPGQPIKCEVSNLAYVNDELILCTINPIPTDITSVNVKIGGQSASYHYGPLTINGALFFDQNKDNKYQSGETLLSGYTVTIKSSNSPTQTIKTNSNGQYSFIVPPNEYYLVSISRDELSNYFLVEDEFYITFDQTNSVITKNLAVIEISQNGCIGDFTDYYSTPIPKYFKFQYGDFNIFNYGLGWCQNCLYKNLQYGFPRYCKVNLESITGGLKISYDQTIQQQVSFYMDDGITGTKKTPVVTPPIGSLKVYLLLYTIKYQGSQILYELNSKTSFPLGSDGISNLNIPGGSSFSVSVESTNGLYQPILCSSKIFSEVSTQNPLEKLEFGIYRLPSENLPVVKFYTEPNQKGSCINLPYGKYKLSFLNTIGWANKIQSFDAPTNLQVFISTTDSVQTVITTIPFSGKVNTGSAVGQQIEITPNNLITTSISNQGDNIDVPYIVPLTLTMDGVNIHCYFSVIYRCWIPSNIGTKQIQLSQNGELFYKKLSVTFVNQIPLVPPSQTQGYLLTSQTYTNILTWKSGDGTIISSLEFTQDGTFSLKVKGQEIYKITKSNHNGAGSNAPPYKLDLQSDGNLCINTIKDSKPAWCLMSKVLDVKYLQMTSLGMILQNEKGEIVWSRHICQDAYKIQLINPLTYGNKFLNLDDKLYPGNWITNGKHYLIFRDDGELMITNTIPGYLSGDPIWKSNFNKLSQYTNVKFYLHFGTDGNICSRVQGQPISYLPYWCAFTHELGAKYLTLMPQDSLNLEWGIYLLSTDGRLVWGQFPDQNSNSLPRHQYYDPYKFVGGNFLVNSQTTNSFKFQTRLYPNQFITNGRFYLKLETNGILKLYDAPSNSYSNPVSKWDSKITVSNALYAEFNSQGIVVVGSTQQIGITSYDSSTFFNLAYFQNENRNVYSMLLTDPITHLTGGIVSIPSSNAIIGNYFFGRNSGTWRKSQILKNNLIVAAMDEVENTKGIFVIHEATKSFLDSMFRAQFNSVVYIGQYGHFTSSGFTMTAERLLISNVDYWTFGSSSTQYVLMLPGVLDFIAIDSNGKIQSIVLVLNVHAVNLWAIAYSDPSFRGDPIPVSNGNCNNFEGSSIRIFDGIKCTIYFKTNCEGFIRDFEVSEFNSPFQSFSYSDHSSNSDFLQTNSRDSGFYKEDYDNSQLDKTGSENSISNREIGGDEDSTWDDKLWLS